MSFRMGSLLQPKALIASLAAMMLSATETIATRFEVAWSRISS